MRFPWVKWFPGDHLGEISIAKSSLAARGLWSEAVNVMLASNLYSLEGSYADLARICRCSESDLHAALPSLKASGVCDVTERSNSHVTLLSRRLLREHKARETNRLRVDRHRQKQKCNAVVPSAYGSVSESGSSGGDARGGVYHIHSRTVLHWLNENAGVHYREVDANLSLISARLQEPEVTVDGVKAMIQRQVSEWKNTDMEKYLRPETLFCKSKFDSYYANRELKIVRRDQQANGERKLRPGELKAIIEAKEAQAAEIRRNHCVDVAMGDSWKDASAKQQFFQIRREIKETRAKLSSYTP